MALMAALTLINLPTGCDYFTNWHRGEDLVISLADIRGAVRHYPEDDSKQCDIQQDKDITSGLVSER